MNRPSYYGKTTMTPPPQSPSFVEAASVKSLRCVSIRAGVNASSPSSLLIESAMDQPDAIRMRSGGGMQFSVQGDWYAACQGGMTVHNATCSETTRHRRVLNAETLDIMASAATIVSNRMRLQCTTDPLELQSFNHTRNGIALRCPRGGVSVASGPSGIHLSTTGDISLQPESANRSLYLAAHGTNPHSVHIGTPGSSAVMHCDLTVKGKLHLTDTAVVERHVTAVHETNSIVRLSCDRSDIPFDFAVVSRRCDGSTAGLVFDHRSNGFYFARRLGAYTNTAFAPPLEYAGVCLQTLEARGKIKASCAEMHQLQCRIVKHAQKIMLNAPSVHCVASLSARTLCVAETITAPQIVATEAATTAALRCSGEAVVHSLRVEGGGLALCDDGRLRLDGWLANTVGPHGAHRTLQDAADAEPPVRHVVLQPGERHNCTALVNQTECVIDGGGGTLSGVLEVTQTCTQLTIQNAVCDELVLHTSDEYRNTYDAPTTYVLRNLRGTLKDWSLALPKGQLRIEHATLCFLNPIIGVLGRAAIEHSTVRGTPWCNATGMEEYVSIYSEADRPRLASEMGRAVEPNETNEEQEQQEEQEQEQPLK